jgi:hypothetical protein
MATPNDAIDEMLPHAKGCWKNVRAIRGCEGGSRKELKDWGFSDQEEKWS